MFEIIKVKTFQGDEYKISGNEKEVIFEHRPPPPYNNKDTWDILYRQKLSEDGVRECMLHLASEIKDLAFESRMLDSREEFYNQAEALCWRVPSEDI